jgi:hypothetical protein
VLGAVGQARGVRLGLVVVIADFQDAIPAKPPAPGWWIRVVIMDFIRKTVPRCGTVSA